MECIYLLNNIDIYTILCYNYTSKTYGIKLNKYPFNEKKIWNITIMKKYKTAPKVNKNDIQEFRGYSKEILFHAKTSSKILPLEVSCFGITYPDKEYLIVRSPSPCFIIEFVESGVGYLELDEQKYRLEAGDAYIIHPGDNCRYYSDSNNPYKKLWINFRSKFFFELVRQYNLEDRVFSGVDLKEFFDRIFALENISSLDDELCVPASRIISDMFFYLAEKKQSREGGNEADIALSIKSFLDHSVLSPISLDNVAQKFYRSKNDIIRCFKRVYGVTPYAYLISQRIELAQNLLSTTRKTVKEISKYLCFSSEYYFSNYFKQYVGVSPRAYRNLERGNGGK